MAWKFFNRNNTAANQPKKSKAREWLDALVFAIVAATIIRGLLFSAYAIPSGSMEGTEMTGDYLFVSKFNYGARMPITLLSIPFTEPNYNGIKTYSSAIQLPYFRLPGFSEIKKGDIVVFNKPSEVDQNIPVDQRTTLIKRCQATPGDVLNIVGGQVYINGVANPDAPKQQTSYTVVTDGQQLNPEMLSDLRIEVINAPAPDTMEMIIPPDNVATLKGYSNIKSVTPYVAKAGQYDANVFPFDPRFKWNQDNYGPLQIPKRGMTVKLNDSTLVLYRQAIEKYENNKVEGSGDHILINGSKATSYTFKMNYYWMMGDNRHNSLDSRFWGYVPEDHVIGKAMITFFSTDSAKDLFHKIRWSRVLRPIN